VPLDQFAPGTATLDVGFAIRRHTAPGPARGVLVLAPGGAGASGIAAADAWAEELGATIRARWDLVVFDQRGIGRSGPIDCPTAATVWRRTDATAAGAGAATPTATEEDVIRAAAAFADACIAESGVDPATLRFYGTKHVAEDLEALRVYLGAERWTLYGEAFGSLVVQQYAAAHPDAVDGLIVDAPIDPEANAQDLWLEMVRAYDQTLSAVLAACTTSVTCTRDMAGGNALAAYDALARQLSAAPVAINVPDARGRDDERTFSLADLGTVAAAYVATETDRMLLQRAIAAASQDRWWLLARMLSIATGVDPETGEAVDDPSRSDALYYAAQCADHEHVPGSGDPAAEWLRIGREDGTTTTRLGHVFATDLPCATWPADPDPPGRPAGVTDAGHPVIVLGATLDPITPWANGERIAARAGARDAHTIVTAGGSHITYGRGASCPDRSVNAFLIVDRDPPARGTCAGSVADPYQPLASAARNAVRGTRAALTEADREIVNAPDLVAWDREGELRFGCPFGGWIGYAPGSGQTSLDLQRCAWTEGVPLTGSGSIANATGALRLTLDSGDAAQPVIYARTGRGEVSYDGVLPGLRR